MNFLDKCMSYQDKKTLLINTRVWFIDKIIKVTETKGITVVSEGMYVEYTADYLEKKMRPISSYAAFEKYLMVTLKAYKRTYDIEKTIVRTNDPTELIFPWPTKRTIQDRFVILVELTLFENKVPPADYFNVVTFFSVKKDDISIP